MEENTQISNELVEEINSQKKTIGSICTNEGAQHTFSTLGEIESITNNSFNFTWDDPFGYGLDLIPKEVRESIPIKNTCFILDKEGQPVFKQGYALIETNEKLKAVFFQIIGQINFDKIKKIYPDTTNLLAEFCLINKKEEEKVIKKQNWVIAKLKEITHMEPVYEIIECQNLECWYGIMKNQRDNFKQKHIDFIQNFAGHNCSLKDYSM